MLKIQGYLMSSQLNQFTHKTQTHSMLKQSVTSISLGSAMKTSSL